MASHPLDLPGPISPASKGRVEFMDGVRAAAIFGVVCSHSTRLISYTAESDPLAISWIANILHTGTSIFLFVSGFLFAHLARSGWTFRRYIVTKGERVLLPYLVTSLFLVVCLVPLGGITPMFLTKVLVNGTAGLSLWYIPFITLIFLLAPAFLLFRDAPRHWRWALLAASLVLALLVHRPPGNLDKLQALCFFAFFYLAGIETRLQLPLLRELASRAWLLPALGAALMVSAIIQGATLGFFPMYATWFAPRPPDIWYATNILLVATLCIAFLRYPKANQGITRRIADDSFGIFFMHSIVLELIRTQTERFALSGIYVVDLLAVSISVFTASWAIVWLVKTSCGKASRYLIGA